MCTLLLGESTFQRIAEINQAHAQPQSRPDAYSSQVPGLNEDDCTPESYQSLYIITCDKLIESMNQQSINDENSPGLNPTVGSEGAAETLGRLSVGETSLYRSTGNY